MTREILFRAKERGKKNFIYGYYAKIGNKDCIICADVEEYRDENLERRNGNQAVEIDRGTLGQYTGLADKNGTKIFEKDIVSFYGEKYTVEWQKKTAKFIVNNYGIHFPFDCYWESDLMVIGNIFDNQTAEDGEI